MHLTQYSGYGLRVLIYTGLQEDRLSTIAEIAEAYDISKNHLMKVVQQLASEGFVFTKRGKNGGIRLASSPEKVCVGQVVRKLEPNFGVADCFHRDRDCKLFPACRLRAKLVEASEAFLGVLDEVTLADLLADPSHQATLRHLLGQNDSGSVKAPDRAARIPCAVH